LQKLCAEISKTSTCFRARPLLPEKEFAQQLHRALVRNTVSQCLAAASKIKHKLPNMMHLLLVPLAYHRGLSNSAPHAAGICRGHDKTRLSRRMAAAIAMIKRYCHDDYEKRGCYSDIRRLSTFKAFVPSTPSSCTSNLPDAAIHFWTVPSRPLSSGAPLRP